MHSRTLLSSKRALILGSLLACGTPALARAPSVAPTDARITLEAARATALKAFSGKIVDEELERENGGSGLRYSFDVRNGRVTREIGVDAVTDAVLENSVEPANPD